jgi:hypothetical protein
MSRGKYLSLDEARKNGTLDRFDALANAGHDTRSLQGYLGHRNINHTVRYTEVQGFLAVGRPAQRAIAARAPDDVPGDAETLPVMRCRRR